MTYGYFRSLSLSPSDFLLKHFSRCLFSAFFLALFVAAPITAHAADRYVSIAGANVANDCLSSITPCRTIQYAVNQSDPGDTVNVASGTFAGLAPTGTITIDKQLTLLGAKAGVDARGRAGAETMITATGGISVEASGVVIDGFTIEDSENTPTGFGVFIANGVDGTRIVNNIIMDNIAGIGLANVGHTQAVIQYNVFQNNNVPGPLSGIGIYTGEDIGGGPVANVLIDSNLFTGQYFAAVAFRGADIAHPDSNITISNNTMDACGYGVVLYNTSLAAITDNTITNTNVAPQPLGAIATAIGLHGGNSEITIEGNNLQNGIGYGIHIGYAPGGPQTIQVHANNIVGFDLAGLRVDDAPNSPAGYATCNWWGNPSGPANPANPGGTGNPVTGDIGLAEFNPWLLGQAPGAECGRSPTITSPAGATVTAGGTFLVTATGTAPMSYSLSNAPIGVSINASTGVISIAANAAPGPYNFTIVANNGFLPEAAQNFSLTVSPSSGPQPMAATSIPTLSGFGLIALVSATMGCAFWMRRRVKT
jgi:nitrous oxidase accessory protein NosD